MTSLPPSGIILFMSTHKAIVVVSGLPRSGTSLTMQMLAAGGLPIVTDNLRQADPDNPLGYYEYGLVKKLPNGEHAWLQDCHGKAIKVISALLEHLPAEYQYRVIFMRRRINEILASQKEMLKRSEKPEGEASDETLAGLYSRHLAQVESWLQQQPNVSFINVDYNELLEKPLPIVEAINSFLGGELDTAQMLQVIDSKLYRQRK